MEIRGLTVRYPGTEGEAVRDAQLVVHREKVVIVGPNGSGKSTLLRAALGLVPIASGEVRVLGRDVRTLQGQLGVGTNLAEVYRLLTVSTDRLIKIWAGLQGGEDQPVRGWLEDLGLTPMLRRPLFQLSTGQAKLFGDLLALGFHPRLVLLDEPFDNVDFGRRRKYLELLKRSDTGVVMNTHELDLLPLLPGWELYLMFEGQLIGRFRSEEIDRLYVSRGQPETAVASFRTPAGVFSITRDTGDAPLKGVSNLSYLLERIS